VASSWAELFAFEVDFCRCAQELLESFGPEKRRRPWQPDVGVVDLVGDFNVAFGDISCMTSSLAKMRNSLAGFMGSLVTGSSGGGIGSGRSAWMLYHEVGVSSMGNVT